MWMCLKDFLDILYPYGALFGAIATFCAVVASLWRTKRDRAIKLVVDNKLEGDGLEKPGSLVIRITNTGVRVAHIVEVYWRIKKKRHRFIFDRTLSNNIPFELADGKIAEYVAPEFVRPDAGLNDLYPLTRNLKKMIHEFDSLPWYEKIRSFKIGVRISIGRKFESKIDKTLLLRLSNTLKIK